MNAKTHNYYTNTFIYLLSGSPIGEQLQLASCLA